ncbi:DUF523 domain-containing protein [Aliamphritea spongicola]|nr:DUF523 domain-containing protein [Aliamphritea spongicola]
MQDYFRFEKFCPEVAAGFGIPRATLRLIGDPHNPRMVYTRDQETDVTEQFHAGYEARLEKLAHLDGYILAKNSQAAAWNGSRYISQTAIHTILNRPACSPKP